MRVHATCAPYKILLLSRNGIFNIYLITLYNCTKTGPVPVADVYDNNCEHIYIYNLICVQNSFDSQLWNKTQNDNLACEFQYNVWSAEFHPDF